MKKCCEQALVLALGFAFSTLLWANEPKDSKEKACVARNGILYNPWEIFDPKYACYVPKPESGKGVACPRVTDLCGHHALIKLANYDAKDRQDLLYSPHRGIWGGLYGSTDPAFKKPPGQNTSDAFLLARSFYERRFNAENKNYGDFLRGRLLEIDATTAGNDTEGGAYGLISHYVTTDNTDLGTLNNYLVDMDAKALSEYNGNLDRRDFLPSDEKLNGMLPGGIVRRSLLSPSGGAIAFIDSKSRRGDIQCQVFGFSPDNPLYEKYRCKFNEPELAKSEKNATDMKVAEEIFTNGGEKNIVIKTTATFDEISQSFGDDLLRRYQWQPHPTRSMLVNESVQYIHDWLVNAPRSVNAWEMNIYHYKDETNRMFCVSSFDSTPSPGFPYGRITTKYVTSMGDTKDCLYGPYVNMLDYLRNNAGNPNYFGFTPQQKAEVLISSNRANLWLLSTAAPIGTSDRFYRWQTLGSEPTYNMSDPVRYLSYPYVAYQIITGDRMEGVRQALAAGMYWNSTTAAP